VPYTLLALVGRDLTDLQAEIPGSQIIELTQGFLLLPLTRPLLESFAEPAYAGDYPDGFSRFFSDSIADKLSQWTKQNFAYLEIDCEGGSCQRTAALFWNGWHVWLATEGSAAEYVFRELGLQPTSERCTNRALRSLGVEAKPPDDELDALGLTGLPFRTAWDNFDLFSLEPEDDQQ
jgi:hypothetical protein